MAMVRRLGQSEKPDFSGTNFFPLIAGKMFRKVCSAKVMR